MFLRGSLIAFTAFLSFGLFAQTAPIPITGATASSAYPGFPASNAVDGTTGTFWSAGLGASPTDQPYIEIQFAQDRIVKRLELVVSQSPNGATSHTVTGRTAAGVTVALGTVAQSTSDGQIVSFTVTDNTPIKYVRVQTTNSNGSWVGWKEIRAFAMSGSLNSSTAQCTIVTGATFCSTPPTVTATTSSGARLWVTQPNGTTGWIIDASPPSTSTPPIGWISAGTFTFQLREGTAATGFVLASTTITGSVTQAPVTLFSDAWVTRPCIETYNNGDDPNGGMGTIYPWSPTYEPASCGGNPKYIVSPALAQTFYKNCATYPQAINCTALTGVAGQLELHGGVERVLDGSAYFPNGEGFQLISESTFNKNYNLEVEVNVKVACSRANVAFSTDPSPLVLFETCFFGLGLYNGEKDYRALFLAQSEAGLSARLGYGDVIGEYLVAPFPWVHANGSLNASPEPSATRPVAPAAPTTGYVNLRLQYFGATDGTTKVFVNNQEIPGSTQLGFFKANPRMIFNVGSSGSIGARQPNPAVNVPTDTPINHAIVKSITVRRFF